MATSRRSLDPASRKRRSAGRCRDQVEQGGGGGAGDVRRRRVEAAVQEQTLPRARSSRCRSRQCPAEAGQPTRPGVAGPASGCPARPAMTSGSSISGSAVRPSHHRRLSDGDQRVEPAVPQPRRVVIAPAACTSMRTGGCSARKRATAPGMSRARPQHRRRRAPRPGRGRRGSPARPAQPASSASARRKPAASLSPAGVSTVPRPRRAVSGTPHSSSSAPTDRWSEGCAMPRARGAGRVAAAVGQREQRRQPAPC
jgi:hypothetical protein